MRKRIVTLTGGVCMCLASFAGAQEAVGPPLYDIEEACGTDRFKRLVVEGFDLFGVATYERPEARPGGELSQVYQEAPGVHVIDHIFYHTDMDTEEFIPPTGLESTTRAYAYLIDEVNRLELSEVRTESMSQP